jgi:NADH-quinone oxidoreductase subunit C
MIKNLYYFNKELKKIINITNPSLNKFELDLLLKKTNIKCHSYNKKNISLIINIIVNFIFGMNWRNSTLIDITCIDFLKNLKKYDLNTGQRFILKYTFMSLNNQNHINFYIPLREKIHFFSLEKIIASTVWSQREIWDMYGIIFQGATDLRRILTDYGFKSFPLRVDFPVFGNLEIYYDIEMSELLFKKIDASQENRFFGYNRSLFWF